MEKFVKTCLQLSNLTFLALFALLSYCNRWAADDYHFLANVKQHGIWDGMLVEYASWSSRYASVLVNHSVQALQMNGLPALPLFNMLSLVLMIGAVYSLMQRALERDLSLIPHSAWLRLHLSMLITSCLFILSMNIGETWFWLCASATYLWSLIGLLYLINYLLHPQPSWLIVTLALLGAIYLGGSAGPLALLSLLGLGLLVFIRMIGRIQIPLGRLLSAVALMGTAFLLLYLAPGNDVRSDFFEDIGLLESFMLNFKMCAIIIIRNKAHLAMMTLGVFVYIFYNRPGQQTRAVIWRYLMLSIAAIFLYQWSITYMTQDIAAHRAQLPVSLIILLAAIFAFYPVYRIFDKQARVIAHLTVILIPLSFSVYHLSQASKYIDYAQAHDERTRYLLEEPLLIDGKAYLKPLPDSGLLPSAEISPSAIHFRNEHLKAGLGLDYTPVLLIAD